MKKFIAILLGAWLSAAAVSCGYAELPPQTEDAATDYLLPKGELPTAEERAELKAIREEYDRYLQQHPQ